MWASGSGFIQISIGGKIVWQVSTFPDWPGFFKYRHREDCEISVEWDNSVAILWAYSYLPGEVQNCGITVWDFGAEAIIRRTGAQIDAWMRSNPDRPVMHFRPSANG